MSSPLALLGGAFAGMAAGAALIPLSRQQLAGALHRAAATAAAKAEGDDSHSEVAPADARAPQLAAWHRVALVAASGLVPGAVLYSVGLSFNTIPPLLLMLGLIQLAWCDGTVRLLPKLLVHLTGLAVLLSGLAIAIGNNEWVRFEHALLGGAIFFAALFVINLLNPKWLAFGDVRLAPAIGFGLTWISPLALLEGFCIANAAAAVIGVTLMAVRKSGRGAALPFGLYLAVGAAITLLAWS